MDELLIILANATGSDALLHQCFRALVHVADTYAPLDSSACACTCVGMADER